MAFIAPKMTDSAAKVPEWVGPALTSWGYASLNPMQLKLVGDGLLESNNSVVCAPTGSGKTLLALLRIRRNLDERKGKSVYIVPLRALAREKALEFKEMLGPLGASVALSTGDLDSGDDSLGTADVIVVTSEKMDSLQRHKSPWLRQISLAVIDETHLLADGLRGATLEVVATKLLDSGCNLLCMSATVPNATELAKWLKARLFSSTWRATPLKIGVCAEGTLYFDGDEKQVGEKNPLHKLLEMALLENNGNGQAIMFVATRRSTESLASELTRCASTKLEPTAADQCLKLSDKALHALPSPTDQCRKLAACLKAGVAFHHAGLADRQRELIEEGFKRTRCIKCIVATTTLAMGVDFPASWVVVRDIKRFTDGYSAFMPNLEIQQMLGRAGRPRFDPRGVGVICCTPRDLDEVRDKYILGPLENIYSQLASEPALRTHSLALIATGYCDSFESLQGFFSKTFYAHQYGDDYKLAQVTTKVLTQLAKWDFVREKEGLLLATPLGKRVSQLYLDPLSASILCNYIKNPPEKSSSPEFSMLLEMAGLVESRPLPQVNRKEEQALWDEVFSMLDGDDLRKLELDEEGLAKYKQAKISNAWINEATEEEMLELYEVPPGFLHSRMRILEWLAYSAAELSFMLNATGMRLTAKKLQKRIKYGVKEELLDLIRLRGIGRIRARKLFDSEIKNRSELEAAGKERIAKILGGKVAEKLLSGQQKL